MRWLLDFWLEQQGQDLIEYSLLLAFVALVIMGFVQFAHPSIRTIWEVNDNTLRRANEGLP